MELKYYYAFKRKQNLKKQDPLYLPYLFFCSSSYLFINLYTCNYKIQGSVKSKFILNDTIYVYKT